MAAESGTTLFPSKGNPEIAAKNVIPSHPEFHFRLFQRRRTLLRVEPKKTVVISVKTSPEMKRSATSIVARTGPGSLSRYIRAILSDLITKHSAGERIAEPPQLLTETQRRILEQSKK